MFTPTSTISCCGTTIHRPSFSPKACWPNSWYRSNRFPGTISCISTICQRVYKVTIHDIISTAIPGPLKVTAPDFNIYKWDVSYLLHSWLKDNSSCSKMNTMIRVLRKKMKYWSHHSHSSNPEAYECNYWTEINEVSANHYHIPLLKSLNNP